MADEKTTAGKETPAAPAAGSGTDDSKLFGALCYIIGVLVPLFVLFTEKKNDKFLVFHAWQSLLLTVVWVVAWIVLAGISFAAAILTSFIGGVGGVVSCLFFPLFLVGVCAILFAAYKAYLGERYKLPLLGDFAEKQVK